MTPCFDPQEQQDFAIGEPVFPLDSLERCASDYTALAFPRGWHSVAGRGLVYTPEGYFVGRAVQDCQHFEPSRIQVVPGMGRDGTLRNLIRTASGIYTINGRSSIGRATLSHLFDAPVLWGEGITLRAVVHFKPTDEGSHEIRLNPELRGALDFKPKGETVEVLSTVFSTRRAHLLWWHGGKDGDGIGKRTRVTLEHGVQLGVWHRVVILLVGAPTPNTWRLRFKYWQGATLVWKYETPETLLIEGVKAINALFAGDEIQNDEQGGVVYYEKLAASVSDTVGTPSNPSQQQFGDAMPPPEPNETLEHAVLQRVNATLLMPVNEFAAFHKYAVAHDLGFQQSDELELSFGGVTYVAQAFNRGIVYAKKFDWDNIKVIPK